MSFVEPIIDIEIDGFYGVFYFEFGKNFSHKLEKHDYWEMVYVDKGEIIAVTEGNGCALHQGQVIFHEPGELHAHTSNMLSSNNMMVVTFKCDSECMKYFRRKTFTLDKTSKTLLHLFLQESADALCGVNNSYEDMRDLDFSNQKFGSSLLMKFHFTEFIIKLLRSGDSLGGKLSFNSDTRNVGKNSIAEMMCSFLSENIYSDVTLDDLCSHFYLGKSQVTAIFKEYNNTCPMHYYHLLKIDEAKKLLRDGELSVSQITEKLCYSGIHNFSRAFKNATGFSPSQYKKSIL